jgi:ABC-type multidrug transport system ATPase subunit
MSSKVDLEKQRLLDEDLDEEDMLDRRLLGPKNNINVTKKSSDIKTDLPNSSGTKLKLSWLNLNYTVKAEYTKEEIKKSGNEDKHYQKQILRNASGYCDRGDALFIMGASGAGKTTLLNVLSDQFTRSKDSTITGEVLINDDLKVTNDNFGAYAAYVTQDDFLFATFTCEKAIMFAAKLRLRMPIEQIQKRVKKIINELSLDKCKDTLVGNEIVKGLSGGEKKR